MNEVQFYEETYKYLVEKAKAHNINKQELERYFTPCLKENFVPSDICGENLKTIFIKMLRHAANSNYIDRSVHFVTNIQKFRKLLFDFDHNKVLNKYDGKIDDLYNQLDDMLGREDLKGRDYKKCGRYKFSRTILDVARFIAEFKDYDEFKNYVINNGTDVVNLIVKKKIFNFANALTSDFIKELDDWTVRIPKPDLHLIQVVSRLLKPTNNRPVTQKEATQFVFDICDVLNRNNYNVDPYKLDKILFLICTEQFYFHNNIKNRGNKKRNDYLNYIISVI